MRLIVNILHLSIISIILNCRGYAQSSKGTVSSADSLAAEIENLIEQQPEGAEELVEESAEETGYTLSLRSRISLRCHSPAGYFNGYYSGSAAKFYDRLLYSAGRHVSGGIILEKDAGEKIRSGFCTMNFAISDISRHIRKIVIGDYKVESGQGLILWSGMGYTKGADIITPLRRKPRGIVTSVSSDEFHFFRGVGTEMSWRSLSAVIFLSSQKRSAALDSSGRVLSLNRTGYHRTTTEQERRSNTCEKVFGGRFNYNLPGTSGIIGLTMVGKKYSREFAFGRPSRSMNEASVDISMNLVELNISGEIAYDQRKTAGIVGIFLNHKRNFKIIFSYRLYPTGYLSVHTVPFGEWGGGERGFYAGMSVRLHKTVLLSCYFDQYRKLNSGDFPSDGNDFLADLNVKFFKGLNLTIQYRAKENEYALYRQQPDLPTMRLTAERWRKKIRITAGYRISKLITVRGRLEQNLFSGEAGADGERGYLFFHDITAGSLKNWLLNVRVSYFSSRSVETVPYEVERDLDGVLSQSMLTGEGVRFYLLAGYRAAKWLNISAKYSFLQRDDVLRIGTGNDRLPSNRDPKISVQADLFIQ